LLFAGRGVRAGLQSFCGSAAALAQARSRLRDAQEAHRPRFRDLLHGPAVLRFQYVREVLTVNGSAKNLRLQKVVYPSGREVYYAYPPGGTIGAAMNRVGAIGSGDANAQYAFLGAAAAIQLDYPRVTDSPGFSYDPNANGLYEGLDRFGRVIEHPWRKTGGTHRDRFTYGYDRAGNHTFRKNVVGSGRAPPPDQGPKSEKPVEMSIVSPEPPIPLDRTEGSDRMQLRLDVRTRTGWVTEDPQKRRER